MPADRQFIDPAPEQVQAILRFARAREVRSVHYVGNADKNLIVELVDLLGNKSVSIMDMPNRWGGGTRFFWDEFESSGIPYPAAPSWLDDVVSYQEGAPDEVDLLIHETPWRHPRDLSRIMAFRRARGWSPIPHVVLLGAARENCAAGIFDWRTEAGVDLGILKPTVKPARKRSRCVISP